VKRSIGIDINEDKISIVQLSFAGGKFSVERASVREMPESSSSEKTTVDVQSLINSMITEENFDMSAKVTVTAPSDRVFFQSFRTNLSTDEDIGHLIKFELEDDFPIPFDELVAGVCGGRELKGDNREYLVGAINRSELRGRVETIQEAHLKCSTVTADVFALYAAASLSDDLAGNTPFVIVHSDNFRIILTIGVKDRLVCARHFSSRSEAEGETPLRSIQVITREIEMTLRAIFGSNADARLKVFISADNGLIEGLSARLPEIIDCEVVELKPFIKIDCSKQQPNTDIVIATGLALIGTNEIPEVLNFLSIDELSSDRTAETKRSLFVAGVLLLVIGALLVVRLFYELNNLGHQGELVKKQIREVFVQTLPKEKRIVNELAQMNEQLETIQAEYDILSAGLSDRVLPLKILQSISEKITPDQNIRINDISMAPESVSLAGIAPSFESVDNVMSVLRQVSEFNTIEVQGIDVDPKSSGVRFTLSITTVLK
jgi:Tfp pilus assembly protein PilN